MTDRKEATVSAGTVEGLLKNGKGIADNNELNTIADYIKTLDYVVSP